MKRKRIIAFALALLMCAPMCASALAATQSGTNQWVGYKSLKINLTEQNPSGDANYLYYTPDGKTSTA